MNNNIIVIVSLMILLIIIYIYFDNKQLSKKKEYFKNYDFKIANKNDINLKLNTKKLNNKKLYTKKLNNKKLNNKKLNTKKMNNKKMNINNQNNKFKKYDLESILERPNIMPNNNNQNSDTELKSETIINDKINLYSSGLKEAIVKTSLLRRPLLRKINLSEQEKEMENKIIQEEYDKDCDDCDKKVNLKKYINKHK